jgi:hypothetical protein
MRSILTQVFLQADSEVEMGSVSLFTDGKCPYQYHSPLFISRVLSIDKMAKMQDYIRRLSSEPSGHDD